ncbi:MAG: crossover junction endodeoxyribonuclease RuvC [Holosporales bacterium]|nr:crossover junction endodeoxyribonuclease RuvC [Holosporales bacterium]
MLREILIVLGIDPGLVITGFGVISVTGGNAYEYITSGVIETKNTTNLEQRLKYIYENVFRLIETHKPQEIAMEEVFINTNQKSSSKLIMGRTAAYLACCNFGYQVNEYAPNTVKKNITGNGHASKDQVHIMVQKIFCTSIDKNKTNDAIDAIAIALCHLFKKMSKNYF